MVAIRSHTVMSRASSRPAQRPLTCDCASASGVPARVPGHGDELPPGALNAKTHSLTDGLHGLGLTGYLAPHQLAARLHAVGLTGDACDGKDRAATFPPLELRTFSAGNQSSAFCLSSWQKKNHQSGDESWGPVGAFR